MLFEQNIASNVTRNARAQTYTPRPNQLLIKVNEPTLLTSQYQNIPYRQQKIMNIEIILLAATELGPYLCMQVIKNDLKIIEIIHF